MSEKSDLIAQITAAYAKRHPDQSIFEVWELRCQNGSMEISTYGGPPTESDWHCDDANCPICSGTGHQPPGLDDILDLIEKLGWGVTLVPQVSDDGRIIKYIATGVELGTWRKMFVEPTSLIRTGETRKIAALKVMLSVVEKEAK